MGDSTVVIGTDKHRCPRRGSWYSQSPFVYDQEEFGDNYRNDQTCSYCGSLHQDVFMSRLRRGDVELTPTDKSYKVYVHNAGGAAFKQTYRNCSYPCECPQPQGPEECTKWVTEDTDGTKFYFPHLTEEQMAEFIYLVNEKKIKMGYPGHFYVLPYFVKPAVSKD